MINEIKRVKGKDGLRDIIRPLSSGRIVLTDKTVGFGPSSMEINGELFAYEQLRRNAYIQYVDKIYKVMGSVQLGISKNKYYLEEIPND